MKDNVIWNKTSKEFDVVEEELGIFLVKAGNIRGFNRGKKDLTGLTATLTQIRAGVSQINLQSPDGTTYLTRVDNRVKNKQIMKKLAAMGAMTFNQKCNGKIVPAFN